MHDNEEEENEYKERGDAGGGKGVEAAVAVAGDDAAPLRSYQSRVGVTVPPVRPSLGSRVSRKKALLDLVMALSPRR